jgi:hypothetical protein
MKLSDLLADVPQEWHRAFVQFVETGEAEQPFLDYLDRDARGQRAVEQAFTAQADALQSLGAFIRSSTPTTPAPAAGASSSAAASKAVVAAFEQVLALPGQERRASLADAAAAIAKLRGERRPRELEVAVADFQEAVEKTAH